MPKDSRNNKLVEVLDTEYKCGSFITKDIQKFEDHLREKGHYQHLTNVQCFYCDKVINAGPEERIEYKHVVDGKAMHKDCRKAMSNED